MIKSFYFENFKSFEKAELELENLTIMIGSNAAGKTNAIEGIKILSEIATGRDFSVILDGSKNIDSDIRGGSKGCCKLNSTYFKLGCTVDLDEEFDIVYSIRIKVGDRIYVEDESLCKKSQAGYEELIFRTKRVASKDSGDIKVEYNNGKQGKNPDVFCIRSSAVLPQLVTKMSPEYKNYQDNQKYLNMVIDDLKGMLFLNPIPSEMRNYSRISDTELKPQADNISSVLNMLCKDEKNKKNILDIIGKLPENDILDIGFIETSIGDVMFSLKEQYGNNSKYIEAKRLSDGTIRCIAVIASLISEKKGNMVIIEEVDNGIHPSRAKSLIDAIAQIANERGIDVIITTHNSALLNAVSKDELIGVSIAYRNEENGGSEFIQFVDINKYPKLLAKGSLGDLVISDEILKSIKSKGRKNKDYSWMEV